jgi:hypothetical protein
MTIQKIKSGRILNVNAETYVGNEGQIFFDEHTGLLRLGDGVTPGGIPVTSGAGGGGNGSAITTFDHGSALTTSTISFNFVGTGVNVNVVGDAITVSIPGAGPQGPQGQQGPKGDTGTQINKVIDIPDINSTGLANGSLLVYNSGATRWDTKTELTVQNIDAGEF